MVRSARKHWSRLPTRQETLVKYGYEKLCNKTLTFEIGNAKWVLQCQILKDRSHQWHLEKGEKDGQRYSMAWK